MMTPKMLTSRNDRLTPVQSATVVRDVSIGCGALLVGLAALVAAGALVLA